MKIMVVGGGGREHAIIKKIKENEIIPSLIGEIKRIKEERNL